MSQQTPAHHNGNPHQAHYPLHPVHHHDPESAARAVKQEDVTQKTAHEKLKARHVYLYAVGRVLLAVLFFASGFSKLLNFGEIRQTMIDAGLAGPFLLLSTAVAAELVGGLMLAVGYKTRLAAAALIAYLAVVTALVHLDLSNELNRAFALGNLAFSGGLLMVLAHGGGSHSADREIERWKARRARA
jgi:putative oxidoreductase